MGITSKTMTSVVELEFNPKVQAAKAISTKVVAALGAGVAVCGVASLASLGMIAVVKTDVDGLAAPAAPASALEITRKSSLSGSNYCSGAKPTASAWDNFACYTDGVATLVEQAGGDVTMNSDGTFSAASNDPEGVEPLKKPYFEEGLCPVNVHWHLGAEHCVDMKVGETYEVHWPHSAFGACNTPNQYQTPFYDGVFCAMDEDTAASIGSSAEGDVELVSTHTQIGVQSQTFTIINDEDYYYPDLFRGMIVEGERGTEITGYTGSTTGTSRSNEVCSAYGPVTWHVDRKCHLISASSFDKMCADMKRQRDDMSSDLHAHGSREVVAADLVANNKVNLKNAYTFGGNN